MEVAIETSWKETLKEEFEKPYFKAVTEAVRNAYLSKETPIYPLPAHIFRAFELCPFHEVKVVVLGQDPYHGKGQAHGLSFSVEDGTKIPPSLQHIYKELHDDVGIEIPISGDLSKWATQGVLLLNATLTVEEGRPNSHQGLGWEIFTDAVIRTISEKKEHVVFLLWGRFAQEKGAHINEEKHLVLKAPHPSPFSAHTGFFGSKHFSQANAYLIEHHKTPILW